MRTIGLSILLTLSISTFCRAEVQVSVKKVDPTVQRLFFDPKRLPAGMPRLHEGEAAICQFNFNVAVNVKYRVIDQRKLDGLVEVVCEIGKADVTLTLENKIFLPRGAPLRLRSHEEAHREISERVYGGAEEIAEQEARRELAKTWTARGKDADDAGQKATQQAITAIGKAILAKTADESEKVNVIFDRLTEHGKLEFPSIRESIKQSFEEHAKAPATQSAD